MNRLRGLAICTLPLLLAGCKFTNKQMLADFPQTVDNAYASPSFQHSELLNVLMLPVDNPMGSEHVDRYAEDLVLAAMRNFGKYNFFNVQYDHEFNFNAGRVVDPSTGYVDRIALGEVGRLYNSGAVLKINVDEYRPYPPMRMKIKAWLLDTETGERIWAFDDTFDMDDGESVNAFKLWWNRHVEPGDDKNRYSISKIRPSMFHNFIFHTMARSYERERIHNVQAVRQMQMCEMKEMTKRPGERGSHCIETVR